MTLRSFAVGLLAIALLLPATAQAQDGTAPHLSPSAKVLYAHHHDSDTAELNGWMNTLATDPTANDIALGPTGQFVGGVPTAAPSRTLTLTLNPALAGTVKLDPTGNIVVNAYIGSGSSNGALRVTTEIKYGTETVATGAAQNHVYQASTGPYGKLTWTLAPTITEFAPGKDLVWTVTMSGVAQAGFLGVSAERGASNIELPVLSSSVSGSTAGTPQLHNLTAASPSFNITAPTPMNATHVYSWSGPGTPVNLVLGGDRKAGNATFVVRDASNATLANMTFTGPETKDLSGAAGNWSITVTLQAFRGNITAQMTEPGANGTGGPSSTASGSKSTTKSSTGAVGGNQTGNGTKDGGSKGSPSPALGLLFGAVAVAVVLHRRRA